MTRNIFDFCGHRSYTGFAFAVIMSAIGLSLVVGSGLLAQDDSQLDPTQSRRVFNATSTMQPASIDGYDYWRHAPGVDTTVAGTQDPTAPIIPPDSNTGSLTDLSQPPESAALTDEKNTDAKDGKKPKKVDFGEKVASSHKPLFYDNDFSYICDPEYDQFWFGDNFKRQSLFGMGQLDMGGQFRSRAHFEQNMRSSGLTGVDDQFLLYRTRLFANWKANDIFRVYAEYIDAESNYENVQPRGIEVNRSDLQNLFFDVKLLDQASGKLTARVGRQELLYGTQRLISPLDWANTRRTFEGYKGMFVGESWNVDAFWTNPIRTLTQEFDAPNRDQEFMGVYSQYKGRKDESLDFYGLRYLNRQSPNDFKINTFGTRWQGSKDIFLWDHEFAIQTGQNTQGSQRSAGFATVGFGRKLSTSDWKPILWLYYDWASGDNDLGAGNGFDHLFPLGHKYMGFMDLFGRRNLEDINLQLQLQPTSKLKILCWYHYLFLETKSDSPYNINMTAFNGGNLPGSSDLGHEIDLLSTYRLNARTELQLGWSHFFSGDYYSSTPGTPFDGDADFFYSQFVVDF